MNELRIFSVAAICLCFLTGVGPLRAAAADLPANVDSALRQVVVESSASKSIAAPAAAQPNQPRLRIVTRPIRDPQSRVLVNVNLNGKTSLAEVHARLVSEGANLVAESDRYQSGVVSAFIPLEKVAELARLTGVSSMSLAHRPYRNIGACTSGGVPVLHTDLLNAQGLNGSGLTVGILSDSFNTATTDENGDPLTIHAADDVATGDLPGPGNPNGHTDPVNVVQDSSPADGPTFDEGRGMLQIVHDIAPDARLAFATALPSEVAFADNIRKLRTDANCDVILDDIIYTEAPFFSDGILAQAVNDVAFSKTLAGHPVLYFSSAGNQQGGGYLSTFNPVSDATARAGLPGQNVNLTAVDPALTSGGFHNFNPDPAATPDISQTFTIFAGDTIEVDLQWNDPFNRGAVTTDYNLLIFDADGNFLAQFSGTSNNFSTDQALEDVMVENPTDTDTQFQIVISRAGTSPATPVAQKLRYLTLDEFGSGVPADEYYQEGAPCTFGHSCALGAIGVAAYVYDEDPSNPPGPPFTPQIEDFTSPGPSTIYFDGSGNRLAEPEIRHKPDIAAPDGGDTTFFGGFDYEGDGFPNFFGTSAAAPHAGGVAALLLQKAGGPGSLTLSEVRSIMQNSLLSPHDLDPFLSEATAVAQPIKIKGRKLRKGRGGASKATLTVRARGDSSNGSANDPNFFTVTFHPGAVGETLQQVSINLSPAGEKFDTTPDTGFPATLGSLAGITPDQIGIIAPSNTVSFDTAILTFARRAFTGSTSVSFGIDRDIVDDGGGNSADLLQSAVVLGLTSKGTILRGTFNNTLGLGYSLADGFGLIDGQKSADQVQ